GVALRLRGDIQFAAEPIATARDQVSGTFMPQKVRIALDAMGGDVGASVVIPGAAVSLTRHPDTEFLLFGDRAQIEAQLAKYPALKAASRVVHTDVAVSAHDKPSQALRRGRKTSSMWLAIDAVKKGEAGVAISAGNTGALMAMARFNLRTLPGVDRPAIAAVWPTTRGESVVLDLGATIGGAARQISEFLRNAMASTWRSRIGYLFARGAFKALRDKLDPNKSNGGVLLGLKGIVVKSHGGTDAEGFAYAIDVGYEMVHYDLLTKINQMLNRHGGALGQAQTAQEAVS